MMNANEARAMVTKYEEEKKNKAQERAIFYLENTINPRVTREASAGRTREKFAISHLDSDVIMIVIDTLEELGYNCETSRDSIIVNW